MLLLQLLRLFLLVSGAVAMVTAVRSPLPTMIHSIQLSRGSEQQQQQQQNEQADGGRADGTEDMDVFAQMTNYRNTQYTGKVYVGSPPQPFNVILDTGSANFWVYSEECNSPACRAHSRFDPKLSTTFSTNKTTFFVKYGSGRINGILSEDNIQLGSLVVPQQIFGAVTRETGSAFMWGKYDGILGLAFPSLAIEGSQPVLDTIIQQGLVTPMFSFYFSSGRSDSAFFIGGVPPSYAHHHYNWHRVIRKGYWEIGLDDVLIEGTSLAACPKHMAPQSDRFHQQQAHAQRAKAAFTSSSSYPVTYDVEFGSGVVDQADNHDAEAEAMAEEGFIATIDMSAAPMLKFPENDDAYNSDTRCKAAVDTGTSLITGPSAAIAKLQDLMGQITNCDDLSSLPLVTFVIDGINYPLTPEQYVLQFDAEDGQAASCLLGFKALDVPPPRGPLWVLGDVFMRAYFSVYDRRYSRVGLTKADVSPNDATDPHERENVGDGLPVGIDTDTDIHDLEMVAGTGVSYVGAKSKAGSGPSLPSSDEATTMVTSVDVVVDDAPPQRPTLAAANLEEALRPRQLQPADVQQQNMQLADSKDDDDDFWQQV